MSWKQKDVLTMKKEIIQKALSDQVFITDLAEEYVVSRQTIYKWINRFNELGADGLLELSKKTSQLSDSYHRERH